MSRNQTRNIETFKIRRPQHDRFGLRRQQTTVDEHQRRTMPQFPGDSQPLTKAERVLKVNTKARKEAIRRRRNESSSL